MVAAVLTDLIVLPAVLRLLYPDRKQQGDDRVSSQEAPRSQRKVIWITIGLLSLVGLFYGYRFAAKAYAIANPVTEILPLPASHIGVNTEEGSRLLKTAIRDDYVQLASVFKAQQYRSYCGVATGVMTVNALLGPTTVDQDNWFSDAVATHRSQWDTFFGGMTLAEFSGMLASFGLNSKHHHGGQGTLDDFRALVRKNLADKQDVLVVNYSRKSLEQKGWGHFSCRLPPRDRPRPDPGRRRP